jgi:ribosomal protein L11 methyltransferase
MELKKFIQLQFSDTDDVQKDQLIALLSDIGYIGFEELDNTLQAFISASDFNKDSLDAVLHIIPVGYKKSIIEEQNWNAEWERSFEPIIVNDFVGVRADFHQPIMGVKHDIIITPKMSFGTGHHATTFMMIEQMEAVDFNHKKVLDFGTGTAVLAIIAEKMGAESIDAIDNDAWSIENSLENLAANNCKRIQLLNAETIATGGLYDIILANINLHVILNQLTAIKAVAKNKSFILLSGFIKNDEEAMLIALQKLGIRQIKTIQKLDWICMLAEIA